MKKTLLWLQIRSLETTADGREKVMKMVTDPDKLADMKLRQANLLLEITNLKAELRKVVRGAGTQAWRAAW